MCTFGYVAGSHMIIQGAFSNVAKTAVVGSAAEFCTDSSVFTQPSSTSLSAYICDGTVWNPIAGPPERISTSTPVYSPLE